MGSGIAVVSVNSGKVNNNENRLSPNHQKASPSSSADPWPSHDEDIDRLVAMHQNRHNSLSSLGVCCAK